MGSRPSSRKREAMQRQVVLPALDDRVGEHAGPGKTLRDWKLGGLPNEDRSLRVALAILRHELRSDDPRYDEGCGAPLDRLADVFADALERVQSGALDFRWQHQDVDARQIFGDWLSPRGLLACVGAHLVLRLRVLERGGHVGTRALVEHHRQNIERELGVIREALRLLAEQTALELAAALHHLEVQATILVALFLDGDEPLFQLVETLRDGAVTHAPLHDRRAIDRQRESIRTIVFPRRAGSSRGYAHRSARSVGRSRWSQAARNARRAGACRGCSIRCGRTTALSRDCPVCSRTRRARRSAGRAPAAP